MRDTHTLGFASDLDALVTGPRKERARLLGYFMPGRLLEKRVMANEVVAICLGMFALYVLQRAVGTAHALLSVSLNISSSETPPGEWRHVQSIRSTDKDASMLSHTQIHGDKAIIKLVAEWVRGVVLQPNV